MNPKKQKEKERRRARKLADEAWEAAQEEKLDLAEKIIRRATATQVENPVLWNDQGMILMLRQKEVEAEEAFLAALSLAPTYAEPYHHLAAIYARRGWIDKAARMAAKAMELAPQVASYQERRRQFRDLVDARPQAAAPVSVAIGTELGTTLPNTPATLQDLAERLGTLDWHQLGQRLTRDGVIVIAKLLDEASCTYLRGLFERDALFAQTVEMNQPTFGLGVYRYFNAPVPDLVGGARRALYPHAALIANEWQQLLGESNRFPETWVAFRDECHAVGQTTPTPILLKYGPGGFNALHRDLRGEIFFPIQLAVVLSPRAVESDNGFEGGDVLFCDVPGRPKSQRRALEAGLGDAVLFCTRDRLVRVGGTYGLQPVKHGVAPITAGTRFVLGLPFHEYR